MTLLMPYTAYEKRFGVPSTSLWGIPHYWPSERETSVSIFRCNGLLMCRITDIETADYDDIPVEGFVFVTVYVDAVNVSVTPICSSIDSDKDY